MNGFEKFSCVAAAIWIIGLAACEVHAMPTAPSYNAQTVPITGDEFVFIKNTDGLNSWAGETPGALIAVGINDNADSEGLGLPPGGFQGTVIYVDEDATGADDGTTWENAYNFLQDALADADFSANPVEIRVAEGVYTPDSSSAVPGGTGDREATFSLINGISLMGGYAGYGEPNPDIRDIGLYETVLSGDLDGNDVQVLDLYDLLDEPTRGENCYNVVTLSLIHI